MKVLLISGHLTDVNNQYGGVVKSLPGFVQDLQNLHTDLSLMGVSEDPKALNPVLSSKALRVVSIRNQFRSRHSITIEFFQIFRAIRSHDMVILNGYHNFLLTIALIFVIMCF